MRCNPFAARTVHQHRVRLGLSPEQYGDRIGVSGMTVRRLELGFPIHRSTQLRFASDLGVEVDELWPLDLDQAAPRRSLARR